MSENFQDVIASIVTRTEAATARKVEALASAVIAANAAKAHVDAFELVASTMGQMADPILRQFQDLDAKVKANPIIGPLVYAVARDQAARTFAEVIAIASNQPVQDVLPACAAALGADPAKLAAVALPAEATLQLADLRAQAGKGKRSQPRDDGGRFATAGHA